jgi:hypothetical protein
MLIADFFIFTIPHYFFLVLVIFIYKLFGTLKYKDNVL